MRPVLCDHPGCDDPATRITTATGPNTPTKQWFSCERHVPVERLSL